jgi:hypothetical protein
VFNITFSSVRAFDTEIHTWSILKSYGKPPVCFLLLFTFSVCCLISSITGDGLAISVVTVHVFIDLFSWHVEGNQ